MSEKISKMAYEAMVPKTFETAKLVISKLNTFCMNKNSYKPNGGSENGSIHDLENVYYFVDLQA